MSLFYCVYANFRSFDISLSVPHYVTSKFIFFFEKLLFAMLGCLNSSEVLPRLELDFLDEMW